MRLQSKAFETARDLLKQQLELISGSEFMFYSFDPLFIQSTVKEPSITVQTQTKQVDTDITNSDHH